jgi:hypothetical protein
MNEYRQAHNQQFAVPAQETQLAWRKAPSDHTQLRDLCALHYVRKVYKNHTVRLHGRVIDIPKRPNRRTPRTPAKMSSSNTCSRAITATDPPVPARRRPRTVLSAVALFSADSEAFADLSERLLGLQHRSYKLHPFVHR